MLNRKKHCYNRINIVLYSLLLLILCPFMTSCSSKQDYPKTSDIDYTIVTGSDIPSELKKLIKERRENSFELSYSDGSYLYIVKGYGRHDTSGYNVSVTDLYQSDDNIIFETDIKGPSEDDKVHERATYPYIVVKTEYMGNSVVFK